MYSEENFIILADKSPRGGHIKMTEVSSALVVGLGIGTVFVGLIAIIVLCYIMSAIVKFFEKGKKSEAVQSVAAPVANNAPIQNKQEIVAACCAVIAEELGTEANNIRVKSFKRI